MQQELLEPGHARGVYMQGSNTRLWLSDTSQQQHVTGQTLTAQHVTGPIERPVLLQLASRTFRLSENCTLLITPTYAKDCLFHPHWYSCPKQHIAFLGLVVAQSDRFFRAKYLDD